MKYSFNEKIDRTGNHAAKWEEMGKNLYQMIYGQCG